MKFLLLGTVLAERTPDPEFEDINFWEADETELPKLELAATSRFLGANRQVKQAISTVIM